MHTDTRDPVNHRDRLVGRLRSLTVGSTVASIIALAGFGTVAALSDRGSTSDGQTATTNTTTTTTSDTRPTDSDAGSMSPSKPTPTPAPRVSSSHRGAHSTSGSS